MTQTQYMIMRRINATGKLIPTRGYFTDYEHAKESLELEQKWHPEIEYVLATRTVISTEWEEMDGV